MGSNTGAKALILSVASDAALEGPLFHGALNRLKVRGRLQKRGSASEMGVGVRNPGRYLKPGTASETRDGVRIKIKTPALSHTERQGRGPSHVHFLILLILLRFFDVVDD
jgi:hypothetical protein